MTVSKRKWAGALVMGVMAMGLMGGCQEPLFTPDQSRSQYDRFDTVRDQRAPSYVFDEFGNRRPNIRGRLGNIQ
jgi:hypothetical protein